MEENQTIGTYKAREQKVFLRKTIVIVSIVLTIASFFIIKSCTRKTKEEKIVIAAKEYYEKYSSVLPKEATECVKVTLNELISKQLLDNPQDYSVCNREDTYIKVCKLEKEGYQYTPIVVCNDSEDTKFKKFKVGTEADLIPDKSDVRFSYIPEFYTNRVKLYYPNDNKNYSDIIEYYDDAPSDEHFFKEANGVTAYKWYSKDSGTNYWNNGGFTSEQPDGYDSKGDEGAPVVNFTLTRPEEKDYRVIENAKLYRTKEIKRPSIHSYACGDKSLNGQITSTVKCEDRSQKNYKITIGIYYTCDGTTTVPQTKVCGESDWSGYTATQCTKTLTNDCEEQSGFKYTDKVWKWYISGDFRKYYPSGSASASGEKTYYVESPQEGYIKDEDTKKEVFKYFKLSDETIDSYTWVQIGNKYLNQDELFNTFANYGIEVKSISDVKANKKARIKTRLEIRNRR